MDHTSTEENTDAYSVLAKLPPAFRASSAFTDGPYGTLNVYINDEAWDTLKQFDTDVFKGIVKSVKFCGNYRLHYTCPPGAEHFFAYFYYVTAIKLDGQSMFGIWMERLRGSHVEAVHASAMSPTQLTELLEIVGPQLRELHLFDVPMTATHAMLLNSTACPPASVVRPFTTLTVLHHAFSDPQKLLAYDDKNSMPLSTSRIFFILSRNDELKSLCLGYGLLERCVRKDMVYEFWDPNDRNLASLQVFGQTSADEIDHGFMKPRKENVMDEVITDCYMDTCPPHHHVWSSMTVKEFHQQLVNIRINGGVETEQADNTRDSMKAPAYWSAASIALLNA
jgi:hypothetical protein